MGLTPLYPVSARLDDGQSLPGSARLAALYQRVNAAPTALAGPDRVVCPGDLVQLDAGASLDADGSVIDWEWSFSDGVVLTGAQVERAFDAAGDVEVTLTVRDDSGAVGCDTGADTARILVNAPPVLDAGPDRTALLGGAFDQQRFEPAQAEDPDGHGLFFTWEFGDGDESSGRVARHGYRAPGTYRVTLTARDSTGLACGVAQDGFDVTAQARE